MTRVLPPRRAARQRRTIGLVAVAVSTVLVGACSAPAPAAAGPAGPGTASAQRTGYPLSITQPDGTQAIIPTAPTRIVTVNNPAYAVEYLVALGVSPIGGQAYPAGFGGLTEWDSRGVPLVVADKVPAFTSVGTAPNKPDLEATAALRPDLIVGSNGKTDYDTPLQTIAPLVSIRPDAPAGPGITSLDWYPEMELLAQVLDRQAEFQMFLDAVESAAAAVRPALSGKTVQLVSAQGDNLYIPGPNAFPSPAMTFIGLTVPPAPSGGSFLTGSDPTNGLVELSLERVSQLTADYIVLETTVGGAAAQDEFLSSPLTQQLPAVKAGHVIRSGAGTRLGNVNGGPLDLLAAIPQYPKAFGLA